ncbi:MAG: hypothetical protein QXS17_03565 [Candidatus Micrarchaeaceae archaeon]
MNRIEPYGFIFIVVMCAYFLLILLFIPSNIFTVFGVVFIGLLYVVAESTKQDVESIKKNSKDLRALLNQKTKNKLNGIDKYPTAIFKDFLILYVLLFELVFTLFIKNSINTGLSEGLLIAISMLFGYVLYLMFARLTNLWELKRQINSMRIRAMEW